MSDQVKTEKTILVVEDDLNLRESIVSTLKLESYNVLNGQNGIDAKNIIAQHKVDLIITDIRMPKMHGIELLHHIKKKKEQIPVIFMTGFSDILEITEAYDMGASGFLTKPFNVETLFENIKSIFHENDAPPQTEEGIADTKNDTDTIIHKATGISYSKIDVEIFRSGSELNFPIFLKLGRDKFVKVAQTGPDLSKDRINELKTRGVTHLYIESINYEKYLILYTKFKDLISTSSKALPNQKIKVIHDLNQLIFENCDFSNYNDNQVKYLKENIGQTLEIISTNDKLLMCAYEWMASKQTMLNHSMALMCIALLVAKERGIVDDETKNCISMASFFHEIGMRKIPAHIQIKDIIYLNDTEYATYIQHPAYSAEILKKFNLFSKDVLKIIEEHHERSNGSGFPNKKKGNDIHPVALLIGLIDEFLYLVKKYESTRGEHTKSRESIVNDLSLRENEFNPQDIVALHAIVVQSF